jgi:ABC-type phosphate transport system permease subunit
MTSKPPAPEPTLLESSTSFKLERSIDRGFQWLTLALAISVGAILLWIAYSLFVIALPAIQKFGLGFLVDSTWDPNKNIDPATGVGGVYGALPHIYGTVLSSIVALLFAVPLGVGVAIFLTENFLQPNILQPIAFTIELLAAVPSVVYGLWGLFGLDSRILDGAERTSAFGGVLSTGDHDSTDDYCHLPRYAQRPATQAPARSLWLGRNAVGNHHAGAITSRPIGDYRFGDVGIRTRFG